MVHVNEPAKFRCKHPAARFIDWLVNGSSIAQSPPADITPGTSTDDNGNLLNTLTIIGRLEYNGTEVQCEAVFHDGNSEFSPNVTLQGNF